jgi:hypothetical protein
MGTSDQRENGKSSPRAKSELVRRVWIFNIHRNRLMFWVPLPDVA